MDLQAERKSPHVLNTRHWAMNDGDPNEVNRVTSRSKK